MTNFAKIRAALNSYERIVRHTEQLGVSQQERRAAVDEALAALAELEKASKEPVAWMWNDELGVPHASAVSKKPTWLESSASAEYIKQANLRPLYTAPPPAPVAARADARIAELEQSVTVRDTEIARLETDLELARRDVVRLKSKVNATFDAIKEHASRTASRRIFIALQEAIDAARAGNGGEG